MRNILPLFMVALLALAVSGCPYTVAGVFDPTCEDTTHTREVLKILCVHDDAQHEQEQRFR